MSGALFVQLVCPVCGKELKGGRASVIFVCLSCRKAFVMENYPQSLELDIYGANFSALGSLFYVPFFRINGAFSYSTGDPKKMRAYGRLKQLSQLFYPAFLNLRNLYSEDLTLQYALNSDRLEKADVPEEASVAEGVANPENLEKIAKYYWLSYLDKAADVTGVAADFRLDSVNYALIPFERTKEGLRELVLGMALKGYAALEPHE